MFELPLISAAEVPLSLPYEKIIPTHEELDKMIIISGATFQMLHLKV